MLVKRSPERKNKKSVAQKIKPSLNTAKKNAQFALRTSSFFLWCKMGGRLEIKLM